MNKNLYMACVGAFLLATLGCSDSNISGSSEDPNVLMAYGSSSSNVVNSSSSDEPTNLSSSSLAEPADLSSSSDIVYSSSSSVPVVSSSSSFDTPYSSSSRRNPVLCKAAASAGEHVGGCAIMYVDLWHSELPKVNVTAYADDSSQFGSGAGKWFWETDSADGGKSVLEWPVELGNYYDANALDSVFGFCYGVCGTFRLDMGDLSYNPYVSVGFNVAGFDNEGKPKSVDVSNWGGICLEYKSDIAVAIVLDLGDSLNQKLGMALPVVVLSRSSGSARCFKWDDFKMPSWAKDVEYKISGEDAAKHVSRIFFNFQGKSETVGEFNIRSIGSNRW